MAGGKGTRLFPYTTEIPKPLVEVGGRPIIEILIGCLKKHGVSTIHVAINHKKDQIVKLLGDGERLGVRLQFSSEQKPLSTVGPLKLIRNLPDHFLVVNSDIITDLNFDAMRKQHVNTDAALTVATIKRRHRVGFGVLHLDANNHVQKFEEKPSLDYIVSTGVYCYSRQILDYLPDDEPFGFDDLMHLLLSKKEKVLAFPFDGYWMDIGRPEDYERAQADAERITGFST